MPNHRPISSLHLIGSRSLGGAENFYVRLVSALHASHQPVTAVSPPNSGVSRALAKDIQQIPLVMRNVFDPIARWRISRLVHTHRPAIVQTYMGRATRLTHLRAGIRMVHVARLGGYYDPKGYRHAHAWIANTRGIRDYLVDHGFPPQRVFHVGNFVDPVPTSDPLATQTLRAELGIATDDLVVLGLGRLHPYKDFDTLLEAFARFQQQTRAHLVIVGDGPLQSHLHTRADQLGLGNRVHWPGWRDDTHRYFALADVLVCSSRQEALGNIILEAWAHNTPVISTRNQGAEELISDGDNGIVVPRENPEALAAALETFAHLPGAVRMQLAENGRRTLEREHSREAVLQRYLEVYRELTSA